jgi:hypothetical protein
LELELAIPYDHISNRKTNSLEEQLTPSKTKKLIGVARLQTQEFDTQRTFSSLL